jgi:D-alanyl-lipoteichoic acid acyltransferase DltB (MBOAT superfamily)
MLFNSLEFALFLPTVVALYFLLPPRGRTPLLLAASCLFYAAFIPVYILILAITIVIDYLAGIGIERTRGRARYVLLVVSIVSTCAVLFVFKYFHFFTDSFVGLAALIGWTVHSPTLAIILPIGLSFHTFQSLSYVVEVYYGRQRAETNFITYATFVMFFPQLVAGPIERPQNLLEQFRQTHPFEYERVTSGLKRIAWGFFKKLVVADRLALYVNDVYAAPSHFNGLQLTIATVFFAYQIYCDFSGYSDIAIGSARILGFRLMENFHTPYHARSISEFWHRWHISLSTWFRDYVYIPLGGSRVSPSRWYWNLMVTFALSGLWHGANWTYVAWGALNGGYLIAGILTKSSRDRAYEWLGIGAGSTLRTVTGVTTTFALTCAAWVVFRAHSLADASYIFTHFWRGWDFTAISTEQFLMRQMPAAVLSIAFLEFVQLTHGRFSITRRIASFPVAVRWPVYAGFVLAVVLLGVYRSNQFIYFQF